MIDPKIFFEHLGKLGVEFYSGVPDSLLKEFCSYVNDNVPKENHVITANEGGAIAIAMGHNMATGKIPLVYMQNSGFGNSLNPLLSLVDERVYSIPILLLIGWRGQPGKKDEPQHIKQGEVSIELLKAINIDYTILNSDTLDSEEKLEVIFANMVSRSRPHVILVESNTFSSYKAKNKTQNNAAMSREFVIQNICNKLGTEDIVVCTSGKASRELFEHRANNNQSHNQDFLTVGGMGHASQIAAGIALAKPERQIYCIDGDGSTLMHTGSLGITTNLNLKNYKHIILNNGCHESVGGQPTIGFTINFLQIAEGFKYSKTQRVTNLNEFNLYFNKFREEDGPSMLEIIVNEDSRSDLGRPTTSPIDNKIQFQKFIRS